MMNVKMARFSGIPNRMKKALKRTKSVGKIERSSQQFRPTKEDIEECENPNMFGSQMKTSRSHESLNIGTQGSLDVIDLEGNDLVVRPLHSSILGQDHCFQIKTSLGSKYYSCRSASERDKWIESILSAHYPDKDERRRVDSTLNIWVVEAKNIPQKKKYFCEICLDDSLYARTTPKNRNDMVFWGEQFSFKTLPAVEAVNVHVYKEIDKKKRRDKNYIGLVSIPINMVNSKSTVESWYRISSPINFRGEIPSVRIKARYQNITILPISQYSDFAQYLKEHSVELCRRLEQDIGVRTKEDVATSLMKILHCFGTAKDFLTEMVMKETESLKDESLVFRANTMATKSMEAYMKLIGGKYLQDTLGDFVQYLYMTNDECEVDPSKMAATAGGTLAQQQENLTVLCEMACCKILNSSAAFPSDLRAVFNALQQRFAERINGDEVCTKLISGCIFLRFLCPAIMSPSLFELIQEYPNEKTSRCLTLIAKTVQALANFTRFGTKENYMKFMNEFLEREWGNMKVFLQEISSATDKSHVVRFSGYIDLGRELALTHSLLSEAMDKFDKASKEKLSPLPNILAAISEQLNEPDKVIPYKSEVAPGKNADGSSATSGSKSLSSTTTSTSGSSTSSTAASAQTKKNLSKIFEDAEPSNSSDVEMLPPYEVAMDKTITKSSTINSLVDFIHQQDSDPSHRLSKLNNRTMNARNSGGSGEMVVTKSEIEVNVTQPADSNLEPGCSNDDNESSHRTKSVKSDSKSSHVYTVCIETVSTNAGTSPVSTSETTTSIPKNGEGSGQPRVLPLSFSNPAFQLSTRALRQKDAATDSMSSVNSTPSNNSDMSNLDGDVSHSSSSDGTSPPQRQRYTKFSKVQSLDDENPAQNRLRVDPPGTTIPHTLPKASHRSHSDKSSDLFQGSDIHLPESHSSSSIHSKMTLPMGSTYTSTATIDSSQSGLRSPTASNNHQRHELFLTSPTEESQSVVDENSNNQSTQTSEATFQIHGSGKKQELTQFTLNMPNPKSALPPNYASSGAVTLPQDSNRRSFSTSQSTHKVHSEMLLTTVSHHNTLDNAQTAHIQITPSHTAKAPVPLPVHEPVITPTTKTHSAHVARFPVLEPLSLPPNKNRTANNSKGQQSSPPMRRNIITQLSTKPKQPLPDPTTATANITLVHQDSSLPPVTSTETTMTTVLQIETRPARVQSGQVVHRVQPMTSGTSLGDTPIWTRRSQDSPVNKENMTECRIQTEYEAEICSLKQELDRMASQLAETKRQLDEEEKAAEAALSEMRVKVEDTEQELRTQQEEKDQQIRDVISRLMCVEEELRAEQEEMRGVVQAKQKIIDAQEIRIQSLDLANQRLMRALQALKQRCLNNPH